MQDSWFQFTDPISGKLLRFSALGEMAGFGFWSDEDQSQRWPVALGIPFFRSDRRKLADSAIALIELGEHTEAVAKLLQDTDDFAPRAPDLADCRRIAQSLIDSGESLCAREIMELLQFGPVADYFALRGSAPTFFSGLGLLKIAATMERPLVEVGCGIGHFLYWLRSRGVDALGMDSVFSKLCIAHYFLNVPADRLICGVLGKEARVPLTTIRSTTVFCHDAFYFIEDKAGTLRDFRRLAMANGTVLVGHAHLATADHGKVSGYPLLLDAYRELAASDSQFLDDAALVAVGWQGGSASTVIREGAEAIAFIEGAAGSNLNDEADEVLHAPIGVTWDPQGQMTRMTWPSDAFAQEYRTASYLQSKQNPFELLPVRARKPPAGLHPGLAIPAPFLRLGVRPLRWGIVGGGWIASDYFVPAFRWVPHAKLVALADPSSQRCKAFSKTAGLKIFSDWREMLASGDLDCIYIATPNDTHAEILEGVAEAGLRVLCEKPLAVSEESLNQIRRCSENSPGSFQTAFDQRYHPAHMRLAERIANGDLGVVTQVRVHYACWVGDKWQKVSDTDNWRIDIERAGGGAGFDLLPHCIDLVCSILRESVADTALIYQHRVHDYATNGGVDDGASMVLRTQNGILAGLQVGYNCPENQTRRRIEIIGTEGRVEALNTMGQDPGGELTWQIRGNETRERFPTSEEAGPFVKQLDAVSRLWIRNDVSAFPFERDIELAARLIKCDAQARHSNLAQLAL